MKASIDTRNIAHLETFFQELSLIDQKKILLASFRKATKPLVIDAKNMVPRRTGNLMKSIGTMAVQNEIAIIVGALKGKGAKGWHGHLVESGTVQRFRKSKKNAATGKMPGKSFFQNAYDKNEKNIFDTLNEDWMREVDNFIVRTNKKLK